MCIILPPVYFCHRQGPCFMCPSNEFVVPSVVIYWPVRSIHTLCSHCREAMKKSMSRCVSLPYNPVSGLSWPNSLRPRQNGCHFADDTFTRIFLNEVLEFRLNFHWSLFMRVQLTLFQHWFRWWLGAGQATSHYLNQWWIVHWRINASLGLNELIRCLMRHKIPNE